MNCFEIKYLKTEESTFYMYHEGKACNKSNNMCSIFLDYTNNTNFIRKITLIFFTSVMIVHDKIIVIPCIMFTSVDR